MDLAAERAYPTPYANAPYLPLLLLSLLNQRMAPKTTTTFKKEYDYIIGVLWDSDLENLLAINGSQIQSGC
ncbi:hypothetical protein TNCV_2849691 [Trichonephila clavipes]|nr:hypothetical protein TNCV_2849691 [Trichonephila clavipes]